MAVVGSGCAVRSMGHMVVQGTVRVRRPGKGQVGISRSCRRKKEGNLQREGRKESGLCASGCLQGKSNCYCCLSWFDAKDILKK